MYNDNLQCLYATGLNNEYKDVLASLLQKTMAGQVPWLHAKFEKLHTFPHPGDLWPGFGYVIRMWIFIRISFG